MKSPIHSLKSSQWTEKMLPGVSIITDHAEQIALWDTVTDTEQTQCLAIPVGSIIFADFYISLFSRLPCLQSDSF